MEELSSPAATILVRIDLAACTDVGRVREHNEDNFLVLDLDQGSRQATALTHHALGERGTLLVVCDGMGGAAAGEVAAQMAIDSIADTLVQTPFQHDLTDLAATAGRLRAAVERASEEILLSSRRDLARSGMGTTLTAVLLQGSHAIVAQVGDSRAYVWRNGRLTQVTRDQSLLNQLLDAGQITAEEAENFEHPNIILQALGVQERVDVQISKFELRRGDRVLVCSDGLVTPCNDQEIEGVLGRKDQLASIAQSLIDLANEAGGPDNITVILAEVSEGLPPPADGDEIRYERWQVGSEVLDSPPPALESSPPASDPAVPAEPASDLPPAGRGSAQSALQVIRMSLLFILICVALAGMVVFYLGIRP